MIERNTYRTKFQSKCPTNGAVIDYELLIQSYDFVSVEAIQAAIAALPVAFHEDIADKLAPLGGVQTLTATHHGTEIVTKRDCTKAPERRWERHYLLLPKLIDGKWRRGWVERSMSHSWADSYWEYRAC